MKILVLCPMEEEYKNFKHALPANTKHDYKVVCCGVGKVSSAATLAVELTAAHYDYIVVIGYAAGHGFSLDEIVIPEVAKYHDTDVPEGLVPELTKTYDLAGLDPCAIYTGDSFITKENYSSIVTNSSYKKLLFDMESAAICQVAEEYDEDAQVLVIKKVSDIPAEGTSFEEFVKTHSDFSQFVSYIEYL